MPIGSTGNTLPTNRALKASENSLEQVLHPTMCTLNSSVQCTDYLELYLLGTLGIPPPSPNLHVLLMEMPGVILEGYNHRQIMAKP